jgi:drug/metabolite transporter (DMT)-like permease
MPDEGLSLFSSAAAAALCVLWGANAVAIKYVLTGIGPFTSAALRFGLSALLLGAWIRLSGQKLSPPAGQMGPLLVNSLLFSLQLSLVYVAFTFTNASRGTLLLNLQPFFLLFLAHFFLRGDRITPLKLAGLVFGFAGAVCVFLDRPTFGTDFRAGDVMILASTLLWALSAAYTKHLIQRVSAIHIVYYQLLFSIPVFVLAAPLWDAPMVSRVSPGIVAALLFQVVFTTCLAFVAWNHLMKKHGAVALHTFVFLIPVSGVWLSGILLGEPISLMILLALALIAGGILVVQLGRGREQSAAMQRQGF